MKRLMILTPVLLLLAVQLKGFLDGARVVRANDYFALGQGALAFETIRMAVDALALPVGAIVLTMLVVWAIAAGTDGRIHTRRAFRWALVAMLPLVALHAAAAVTRHLFRAGGANVVWITIDTLRADHLGAYGYARPTSPHIDALARQGVLFRQAMVQWPKTTPSMASMLTGTYPHTNGIIRFTPLAIGSRPLLFSEMLGNAGYRTIAISTHPALTPLYQFAQGFDVFVEAWRDSTRRSARATEEATTWLREHATGSPFFLWIHYMDPHARYAPPPPYDGMFVGDAHYDGRRRLRLNEGENEDLGGVPGRASLGRRNELAYYVAQYDAEIRYTDENVGAVLEALRVSGADERTIVILTADHGESLGEHDYY
ncbi:MAG: sulfatase, partial [bacterium]